MRELVPTLKVPPLFELEPPAVYANATTATAEGPSTSVDNHRLVILPSS